MSATTVVYTASGVTEIESDTECGAGIAYHDPDIFKHNDGDDVYIPMDVQWHDNRPANSWRFQNWFVINAAYKNTGYMTGYWHFSRGQDHGYDSFGGTVPDVEDGERITITYSVYVYRDGDPPGTWLCFVEGTTYYDFI